MSADRLLHRASLAALAVGALVAGVMVPAGSAAAATSASVTTGPPTFTTTTAIVGGATVDPNGSNTLYRIAYGTTTGGLTQATGWTDAGSGTAPVAESATLTGLTAATTYEYQAQTFSFGTYAFSYGSTVIAATTAQPTGAPTPINPPANPPVSSPLGGICSSDTQCLGDIDGVRAAQENLGPITLPTNWSSLNGAEQIFVLDNLERTSRGEPAVPELVSDYSSQVAAGIADDADPSLAGIPDAHTIWAGDQATVSGAIYDWMYYDGPASSNGDCTTPSAPLCWIHRDGLLANPSSTGNPNVMDAASGTDNSGNADYAAILATVPDPPAATAPDVTFTWAAEQPYLPVQTAPITATAGPGLTVPVPPVRTCDTRAGNPSGLSGAAAQCTGQTIAAGGSLTVSLAGQFGIPSDAEAAVVDVTSVNPSATGTVTVYPGGQTEPATASVQEDPGRSTSGVTEVGLGSGSITISATAATDVTVDLQGYVEAAGGASPPPAGAGQFQALSEPTRVCDTRASNPSGLSGPFAQCTGKTLAAGGTLAVPVAGQFNVPAGAEAVWANVTVIGDAAGSLTAHADGTASPAVTTVSFPSGPATPVLALIPLGADGSLDLTSTAAADVLVDVTGYVTPAGSAAAGEMIPVTNPYRICDTRAGNPSNLTGDAAQCNGRTVASGGVLRVKLGGDFNIPFGTPTTIVAEVTSYQPSAPTVCTIFASGGLPLASNLNPQPGLVETNLVVATLDVDDSISIYNVGGSVDLSVDLLGYYQATPT